MNKLVAVFPWGLTALVAVFGAWQYSQVAINHDVAGYLLIARALVDGRILYESFPDYSMPANAWLALLSLHVATAIGGSLAYVHQAVLLVLTAAGAVLTGLVISLASAFSPLVRGLMPPMIMWLFLIIPGYDFGQRDVLFATLAAPLFAVVGVRHFGFLPNWWLSYAIAIFAAIGASFKPQVALPLLVLFASDLMLRRGRICEIAREWWMLAGLLTLYCAVVQLGYPTYFTQVLPGATRIMGHLFQWIVSVLRSLTMAAAVGVVSVALLAIILSHRVRHGRAFPWGLAVAWAAVAAALALMDIVQHHGLRYHSVPFLLYVLTSLGLFALINIDDSTANWAAGSKALAFLRIGVVLMVSLATMVVAARSYAPDGVSREAALSDPVTRALRALPAGTYVLALQTGMLPISPLHAYADIRWSGEFSQNHEVSAIELDRYSAETKGRSRDPFFVTLEQHIRQAMLRSMTAHPPELVFIDVSSPPRWFTKPFSLLAWFKQDPAFVAIWSHYDYVETVNSFGGGPTEIWRRRASLGGLGEKRSFY